MKRDARSFGAAESGLEFSAELNDFATVGDGPIPHTSVVLAARLVDTSGALDVIAEGRAKDRGNRHAGGRPPRIDDRAALCLLLLCGLQGEGLLITVVADMVHRRLSPASLELLGIENDNAKLSAWYFRVYHSINRMLEPVWYHPGYRRNARLTPKEYDEYDRNRDLELEAEIKGRMFELTNRLIRATHQLVPQKSRQEYKGNTVIDGTFVTFPGRFSEYGSSGRHHIEPHACTLKKRETYHGHGAEAYLVVSSKNDPTNADERIFPSLVMAMEFARQNKDDSAAAACYGALHDNGYPTGGDAVGDRAFFKSADPQNVQIPMRDMGFVVVKDYREDMLGSQAEYEGAVMYGGRWYCPEMPKPLFTATLDFREGRIDEKTHRERIASRDWHAATRKALPDAQGRTRWSHPVDENGQPTCQSDRPNAPRFCAQKTLLFPANVGIKHFQEYPHESRKWHEKFHVPRNQVESTNGLLKGRRHDLAATHRRRKRGMPFQHLAVAVLAVAFNVEKVVRFRAELKDPTTIRKDYRKPRGYRKYSWTSPDNPDAPPGFAA